MSVTSAGESSQDSFPQFWFISNFVQPTFQVCNSKPCKQKLNALFLVKEKKALQVDHEGSGGSDLRLRSTDPAELCRLHFACLFFHITNLISSSISQETDL